MNSHQLQHAATVWRDILSFNQPAEAVLAAYFRAHAHLGRQDRQYITQAIFDLLRRWQAVCHRLPQAIEQPEQALQYCAQLPPLPESPLPFDIALQNASGGLQEAAELPKIWLTHLRETGMNDEQIYLLGASQNQAAPLDLRVNTLKAKRQNVLAQLQNEGLDAQATPYSPWGIRLRDKPALQNHPLLLDGHIEIQDEGSQLLALLTGARRNEIVVDFCAGAGGKSLALGAMMQNTGRLYAFDINEKRLAKLKPRAQRAGINNLTIQRLDHSDDAKLKRLHGKADRVLVDAPCSGMGTLRRHPDLKYRQTPTQLNQLIELQQQILHSAAQLVRPKGHLIYATCSLLPQENQRQIETFLSNHPQFTALNVTEVCPQLPASGGLYLQLWPHQHGTDGFFAAILQRKA